MSCAELARDYRFQRDANNMRISLGICARKIGSQYKLIFCKIRRYIEANATRCCKHISTHTHTPTRSSRYPCGANRPLVPNTSRKPSDTSIAPRLGGSGADMGRGGARCPSRSERHHRGVQGSSLQAGVAIARRSASSSVQARWCSKGVSGSQVFI